MGKAIFAVPFAHPVFARTERLDSQNIHFLHGGGWLALQKDYVSSSCRASRKPITFDNSYLAISISSLKIFECTIVACVGEEL